MEPIINIIVNQLDPSETKWQLVFNICIGQIELKYVITKPYEYPYQLWYDLTTAQDCVITCGDSEIFINGANIILSSVSSCDAYADITLPKHFIIPSLRAAINDAAHRGLRFA